MNPHFSYVVSCGERISKNDPYRIKLPVLYPLPLPCNDTLSPVRSNVSNALRQEAA
jgi:hypothetical protein